MLCLLLAVCNCDRVPALLFIRPYDTHRRWNSNGEMVVLQPPSFVDLPKWPRGLFRSAGHEIRAHGDVQMTSLGFKYPKFTSSMEQCLRREMVTTSLDEEDTFFSIAMTKKEEVWKSTTIADRVLLWLDLVRLTIYAFPDSYAESFCQRIQWCLEEVISSTVLPFLSVLQWDQLQGLGRK